jgi:hypothetical protein
MLWNVVDFLPRTSASVCWEFPDPKLRVSFMEGAKLLELRWSLDLQQHHLPLGACLKCKLPQPSCIRNSTGRAH